MIKKVFLDMRNAMWKSLFAPTLLQIDNRTWSRLPNTGSDYTPDIEATEEFRKPFKDSLYNVRYNMDYENKTRVPQGKVIFMRNRADPTPELLYQYGLITEAEKTDERKVAQVRGWLREFLKEDDNARLRDELCMGGADDMSPEGRAKLLYDALELEAVKSSLAFNKGKDKEEQSVLLKDFDPCGTYREGRIAAAEIEQLNDRIFEQGWRGRAPGAQPQEHVLRQK